jgi:hypothetical protein
MKVFFSIKCQLRGKVEIEEKFLLFMDLIEARVGGQLSKNSEK